MTTAARPEANHPNIRLEDCALLDNEGSRVRLSSLFGDRRRLVILHNMGQTCPNCLIYGSEFNGAREHIEKKAAFSAVGPDSPEVQAAYMNRNGWKFKLYSGQGTSFIKDAGFENDEGKALPGVSILKREEDAIIIESQVNIATDGWCPSALEILWMLPDES